jgi:hypothetical protein
LGAQLKAVLEKVSALEELVKNKAQDDHPVLAQPPQQNRKHSLIILNVPESGSDLAADRLAHEKYFLQNVVSKLFEDGENGINVEMVFRLGRKSDDPSKPRPLKVILRDVDECRRVLARTYRLKGENYFIVRDLSPENRSRMRDAVKELKERRANDEQNLKIVDFRVVVREPKVRWKPLPLFPHNCGTQPELM